MAGTKGNKGPLAEAERLLERAYNADEGQDIEGLLLRVLELDPRNPEALLLQADATEDHEERLRILGEAVASTRERMEAENPAREGGPQGLWDLEDLEDVYLGLLTRAAMTLCALEKYHDALLALGELRAKGGDLLDGAVIQGLYYRALIGLGEWARILSETLREEEHGLGWAYGRLCAAFMLARDAQGRRAAAQMFWEALSLSPNVPFYMMGYFPEPEGEDEEEMEDFHFASLYSDVWTTSPELYRWFVRGTLLFGLLSGRFEDEEHGYAEGLLDALGGREEYDRMRGLIQASDDETIIETLAAHRCLAGA